MKTPRNSAPNIFNYPTSDKSPTSRPTPSPRKPHIMQKSMTFDHNTKPNYQIDTPARPPKVCFCIIIFNTLQSFISKIKLNL